MRSLHVALLTTMLSVAAACGGGTPEPTAPTAPSASTAATPPAPTAPPAASTAAADAVPTTWSATMPKEQQIAFMKKNVAPHMGKVFQEHDATRYAAFGCKTCHGPEYKVPKEYLPHLTFKDGKITAFQDKPEIAKWMHEKVAPEMASAMGMQPYDPQTKQGFGCMGCHTVDMK